MFNYFSYYDIKVHYLSFVVSLIYDTLRRITAFYERHRVFSGSACDVTSEI